MYSGHKANVTSLGFSSSGTWMYTGSEDETVKIWDVRARPDSQRNFNVQKPINTVALHTNEVRRRAPETRAGRGRRAGRSAEAVGSPAPSLTSVLPPDRWTSSLATSPAASCGGT